MERNERERERGERGNTGKGMGDRKGDGVQEMVTEFYKIKN